MNSGRKTQVLDARTDRDTVVVTDIRLCGQKVALIKVSVLLPQLINEIGYLYLRALLNRILGELQCEILSNYI